MAEAVHSLGGPLPKEEESRGEDERKSDRESAEPKSTDVEAATGSRAQKDEEEEEETCGFCKFMKGGACKDVFVAWEACVDSCRDKEGGDFVENCLDQTKYLKECMEANADYYGIMLQAEEESLAAKEKAAGAAEDSETGGESPKEAPGEGGAQAS